MPVTSNSARDPVRVKKRALSKARAVTISDRLMTRVLNLRALGTERVQIAYAVRGAVKEVNRILQIARNRGDARALSDAEAAAVAEHAAAETEAPPVPTARVAVVVSSGPIGSIDPARLARDPGMRAIFVDGLRSRSPLPYGDAPLSDLTANTHHLADLYEHCDRFYPSVRIVSDGLTTRRIVPEPSALGGGAGLLCAQA
ncbi:hypothetical protein [Methylobacterium gnaphalii]|uniref:Uncharacterized protein n=1 Tax=Methylobacterium gnaphalii TaxID=1010610 RepID=A0A512JPC1_9HYPH|nr:hypothetical protein [Methylobacterium gnaphalii]GEP11797.1 hypothetical protein MGN01_36420 [Methylobacterium gnaphalii]GJD69474.1 hypothetical protein MMMDOFMJ_2405 [Methylobacterium gnaphalii]GLS49568.1 hypothetical protein GCM10007885_24170 [Methylobacterium gnaphalii]